ncbi:nuclease-related domain-containing DEAD/DEAH box helicase [Ktedonospora formicarum]|uniref:DNA helicase n=1 Tax=Ktedonospora formicarum TaxID=2778364 RepID=A0A8J3I3S0_9CHLR|nr:nuclease-related domain-containing DEAD/DEAH box helicase [Ktedonospora formicarum]GHO49637.1 hypothetical protein KSX_78000 [Ktedonospora formicarum]
MTAQIINASGPHFSQGGGAAERDLLVFLQNLPGDYYVIREGKLTPSRQKQSQGSKEDRPDFIVIGPATGIMILEVKDWNVHTSTFEFVNFDQVRYTKRRLPQTSEYIDNPWHQAKEYNHAIRNLFQKLGERQIPWVSHFVVFPRLTRADFNNNISIPPPTNPQNVQVLDSEKHALFKDDLDKYKFYPLDLLKSALAPHLPNAYMSLSYSPEQIQKVVKRLIPHEILVGGLSPHIEAEKKLALLDQKQQEWALSNQFDEKRYLADVAGSGKTNVLLSRAIHLVRKQLEQGGSCNILVTTYSKPLGEELKRIFHTKLGQEDLDYDDLVKAIKIQDIHSLMETIAQEGKQVGLDFTKENREMRETTPDSYYNEWLPGLCKDIIAQDQERFKKYDFLFIDEIQDFHNELMNIARGVLKNPDNILAVGDIGQKLLPHTLDWGQYNIIRNRIALQGTFRMYRNPKPVAKLAWQFLTSDRDISQELQSEGYQLNIAHKSPLTYKPVFIQCTNEDELLQDVCQNIQDKLYTMNPAKILCVGLNNHLLLQLYHRLKAASIPVRMTTEQYKAGDYIILADYIDAKGLERELVYIIDADNLNQTVPQFTSLEVQRKYTQRERIKLFVALTRTTREVRLYYIDRTHPFIRELLSY